jgi:hypothetical protein
MGRVLSHKQGRTSPGNDMQTVAILLDDLERFHAEVRRGIGSGTYSFWIEKLRPELEAIADIKIRQQASELFAQVAGGGYVLQRNPEMRQNVVLPAIQSLIDCLRRHLPPNTALEPTPTAP